MAKKEDKPKVVITDLEEVLTNWAKDMFSRTANSKQKKIPKENLQWNINWKRLKVEHSEPIYQDEVRPQRPNLQTLFKTSFQNTTDSDQSYSFKTERSTTSSCEIEMEKGFTYGAEMHLGLKTPCEIFEAGVGFKKELTVTKKQGTCHEETVTWSVDNQIAVPRQSEVVATLEVFINEMSSSFKIETIAFGHVVVTVTNLGDNNSLVKVVEGNIADIIRYEQGRGGAKNCTVDKNKVLISSEGKCTFRYGMEQNVKVFKK